MSNTVNDIVRQNDVYVYDSLLPNKVDLSVIKQVCSLVKSPSEHLYFNIVDVMRQRNSFDCGLHALATVEKDLSIPHNIRETTSFWPSHQIL